MLGSSFVRPDWPAHMVLTTEPRPRGLLELLSLREAWRLAAAPDVPGLDVRVAPWQPSALDERAWAAEFERIVDAYDRGGDTRVTLAAVRAVRSEPEYAPLESWMTSLVPATPQALAEEPEYRAGRAAVAAWERGLRTIVSLPLREPYSRVAGSVLLVSASVRTDDAAFRAALDAY